MARSKGSKRSKSSESNRSSQSSPRQNKTKDKKKGKNKEKKRKGSPPRTYNWITLAEVRAREAKYATRLADIKVAKKFVDSALMQLQEMIGQRQQAQRWNDYANCVNLPEPYIPPEIRTFFEKMKYFEEEDVERTINWLLAVDERSILTQNIFTKNLTKKKLIEEILPDLGGKYDANIKLGLQIHKNMEYFFEDTNLVSTIPKRLFEDIVIVKSVTQSEIASLLDRLSYRLICCEDAYMKDVDPRTAEYIYTSPNNNFTIHIWCLKHIPIRFEHIDEPYWDANLHGINLAIRIPLSVLEDDLTLRGIHMNYDHLSETAISFNPEVEIPDEDLNAGIPDLYECLVNEWLMQLKLQEEVRNSLIEKRVEFDIKKKEHDEEEAKKSKDKKTDKKKDKKKDKSKGKGKGKGKGKKTSDAKAANKGNKDPVVVAPGMYPDIWNDFIEKEQKDYENFMNKIYHPDTLKLQPDEINLKQYFIVGGIYHLFFLDKPRHYCIQTFNMTWHENASKLNVRQCTEPTGLLAEDEDEEEEEETERLQNAFKLTFTLPEYLCFWGQPIVCQFEDDAIRYIDEEATETALLTRQLSKGSAKAAAEATEKAEKKNHDSLLFESSRITTHIGSHSQGSISNVFRPLLSFVNLRSSVRQSAFSQVYDFCLDLPLTKPDLRNLERHCVPRILSSYRFKKEIDEAVAEKTKDKTKGRGGVLLRKQGSTESEDSSSVEVTFKKALQDSPERMFTVFHEPEPLKVPYDNVENIAHPETFVELLQTLDDIKNQYLNRPNSLLNLPDNFIKLKPPVQKTLPVILQNKSARDKARISQATKRTKGKSDKSADRTSNRSITLSERKRGRSMSIAEEKSTLEPEELQEEELEDDEISEDPQDQRETYKYAHWTTKYIEHTEFDRENRTLTVYARRLGIFGLAYDRYQHFPFRKWTLEPTEENEVTFTVETEFLLVILTITPEGVKGYVTDPMRDGYISKPKKHLEILEPISDFKELKKRFREKNLNIFAELDAAFYINGYFSQKHLAVEMHVYNCMAVHCASCKFMRSGWNRLSKRREIVFQFSGAKEVDKNFVTVRIRPEDATFVEVKELCSDNLDVFKLQFTPTWRNINSYHDLHNLILSMFPGASDNRLRDPMLLITIKNILSEVRPLSYS